MLMQFSFRDIGDVPTLSLHQEPWSGTPGYHMNTHLGKLPGRAVPDPSRYGHIFKTDFQTFLRDRRAGGTSWDFADVAVY